MVWLNPGGTPEGDERCRRLNQISASMRQAFDDQVVAHIRNFVRHWPMEERKMLRAWASDRSSFEKHYRFHQLRRACTNISDDNVRLPIQIEGAYPIMSPAQCLAALDSIDQTTEE